MLTYFYMASWFTLLTRLALQWLKDLRKHVVFVEKLWSCCICSQCEYEASKKQKNVVLTKATAETHPKYIPK